MTGAMSWEDTGRRGQTQMRAIPREQCFAVLALNQREVPRRSRAAAWIPR
jgi:hypothetical protein